MTYEVKDEVEEEGLAPARKLRVGDSNGDYVILVDSDVCGAHMRPSSSGSSRWWSMWWWAKLVLVVAFLAVLAALFFKWVGPFFMDKEIIPIIDWETATFSTPVLGILIFASVALFPALLLPSTPSMWVAGMTFGYGYGFLLIITGVAIDVKYGPYMIGSLIGMVPEIFVAIYTGILIKTLAEASHDQHVLSAPQIIFNVIGFCITVFTTVMVTVYAKRRLSQLQKEEELLLQ